MIQLLTSDSVRAEQLGDYVAQDWRSVEAVRAGWSVGFGPVTKVLFLQDAAKLPALPAAPDRFMLEGRERQWLRVVRPHRRDVEAVGLFELRTYDARVGQAEAFLELMLKTLPVRERHSPNCGVWESLSGRHGQVLHMWGYSNMDERNAVRAGLKADPEWQHYIATVLPMLQTLNSTILTPLPLC